MSRGVRHLVECRCILPQFMKHPDPPIHQFPVFSVVEDDDSVGVKFVQCPNCGVVHKVIDIARSEIITGRETLPSSLTKDDLRESLPPGLGAVLDKYECDVSVWENVKFIVDEKRWGDIVILISETVDGMRQGKYMKVLGEHVYKVEAFVREETVNVV